MGKLKPPKQYLEHDPLRVLKRVRKLFTNEKRWCQGCYGLTQDHKEVDNEFGLGEQEPVQFCLLGAIHYYTDDPVSGYEVRDKCRGALEACLARTGGVIGFNDYPRRTHEQILRFLDRAIKKLERA